MKRTQKIQKDMQKCMICPRKCGVNRNSGQLGICGQTDEIKVARAALHMWEEPCISGANGSGTVFFSGCSLHCVFCQNQDIANGTVGKVISVERLAEIFLELQGEGANNINLVTPGQFVPQIIAALDIAKSNKLKIPIVYNTSSYELVETIKMLEGYVDVYLPDLKYRSEMISKRYSHASDYFAKASKAIAEMVRQTRGLEFYKEGDTLRKTLSIKDYQQQEDAGGKLLMKSGTIVRHLVLPGCEEDSKAVIQYLLETYGSHIFVSIMNQYTPVPQIVDYPELNRQVRTDKYEEVIDYAIEQGIENGFMQEGETAKESFIPEFDGLGI